LSHTSPPRRPRALRAQTAMMMWAYHTPASYPQLKKSAKARS
jgi:hypothetical protein